MMNEEIKPDTTTNNQNWDDLKFWRHRIKFDSIFLLSYLILSIGINIITLVFVYDIDVYLATFGYIPELVNVALIYFFLYLSYKIFDVFKNKILNEKEFGVLMKDYEGYKREVHRIFSKKVEFYIPLVVGILLGIGFPVSIIPSGLSKVSEIGVPFIFLAGIFGAITSFMVGVIMASAIITILFTFICLNKLGKEFHLKVKYIELRSGKYEAIGKMVISFTIPAILFSTFLSIVGMFSVFLLNHFFDGFTYMLTGLMITAFLGFLLYKNTDNIHEEIVVGKQEIKEKINEKIQVFFEASTKTDDKEELHKIYLTIVNMQNFLADIDAINDWPFNPSSIKKLVITLGSSVVPIFLSLFGL